MRASEGECAKGWLPYNGTCYRLAVEMRQWKEARSDCWAQGAFLAHVWDQAENDFLEHDAINGIPLYALQSTSQWSPAFLPHQQCGQEEIAGLQGSWGLSAENFIRVALGRRLR